MTIYFARASTKSFAWLLENPDTATTHGVVLHPADNSVARDHIHFITTSDLGFKAFRKWVRDKSGLTSRMDIMVKPFDGTLEYSKYLLRNTKCELLYYASNDEIGSKLYTQSLSLSQVPVTTATSSEKKVSNMSTRINNIYAYIIHEQTFHTFGQFADEMLQQYYRGHLDEIIPGEGSINVFKSYILHLWGIYIQNHMDDEWKSRARSRYAKLLFGQNLVDPVNDASVL